MSVRGRLRRSMIRILSAFVVLVGALVVFYISQTDHPPLSDSRVNCAHNLIDFSDDNGAKDRKCRVEGNNARTLGVGLYFALALGGVFAVSPRIQLKTRSQSCDNTVDDTPKNGVATHRSTDIYRLLFESSPQPMWVFDVETLAVLSVNDAAVQHYGYSHDEFLELTIGSLVPTDDLPHLLKILSGRGPGVGFAGIWRHLKKDGSLIAAEVTSQPLEFDGRAAELLLANDVTERLSAERELVEQRLFLRRVIDLNPNFIFAKDKEGRFTLVNKAVADAYGTTVEDLLGKSDSDFSGSPEEAQNFRKDDLEVIETGKAKEIAEEKITDAAGAVRYLQTSKRPIVLPDGTINQLLGVSTDITARRRAEEDLRALNKELEERVVRRTAQLEEANSELEAFSYSVSHDLRAPLRAMNGFSRILLEDYAESMPTEAQRYLRLVNANARQMGALVDDLLAFSRLGRQALRIQPVDTLNVVEIALVDLLPEREGRNIKTVFETLPNVPADAVLLRQVFVNLLSNALKFTRGRIESVIEVGSIMEADHDEITFYIKDNGAGFDMAYSDKLFGVFQRLHRAEDFEGTGVGLAIVQRIIHRHGGRIWAEGELNKGATFFFTLPKEFGNDRRPR